MRAFSGIDERPKIKAVSFHTNAKNRNLSILLITWVLFSLTRPLFYQFESDYVNRLGASPEIIGLMGSSVVLVSMLIQIPGGYLADKRGVERT
ncbi:MAG: hypothetical protein DRO00_05830 [Thermoproteota archaeon]|nr:MAG: hypothetical protein DRO00_05830 [Candidatus Korarchaeota archaeon]